MTVRSAVIFTRQAPRPEHAPDQPANPEPRTGLAVSVTNLPLAKLWEQLAPQLMPTGELVTEPRPEPFFNTVRRRTVRSSSPCVFPELSS
ncbi:MAG: hypothetical protein E6G00_01840 [Actinobacteria bacterium]|nr:MAG: hypothetical protein E6G00_01840 [Actinomycetota bacterium]